MITGNEDCEKEKYEEPIKSQLSWENTANAYTKVKKLWKLSEKAFNVATIKF